MVDHVLDSLRSELDDLRRRHRSTRRLLILLLVVGAGCAATGFSAPNPNEMVSERFVLVDGQRRVRALLRLTDDGTPWLSFYNQAGRVRASISGGEAGADVSLCDARGQKSVRVRSEVDGRPKIEFFEADGRVAYTLPTSRPSPK